VNWRHLQAFAWLRWRIMNNQWRRGGALNAVLMLIIATGAVALAVPLLIAAFMIGLYAIPRAAPDHLMYAWDALVLAFLFFWSIGLLVELQRSEPLALSKVLHLPVSVGGAFLINYLSSLVRLSLIFFVPLMLGFCLALAAAKGALLLIALPLLAAFLLMVTALTYQFQGWLASLMSNPRRRRTAIVAVTAGFVLVCQLPNLFNFYALGGANKGTHGARMAALTREQSEFIAAANARHAGFAETKRGMEAIHEKHRRVWAQADHAVAERMKRVARIANLSVPVGWLPLGVLSAAEGRLLPAVLGLVGMTLIGSASLARAYRTMVRQYQGQATARRAPRTPTPVRAGEAPARRRLVLLEARLPGLSEPVSAIALGGFCSMLRAPEAKMVLLTPVLMIPIFGSILLQGRHAVAEPIRPLMATGALLVILFGLLQLMINQFGFDRDGFRVFVLSAARRRDILLGKNLAVAPVFAGLAIVLLPIVQWLYPLRLDHLLALLPQAISMFLLMCILTNVLSIIAPYHMPAGAMKPSNLKGTVVLLQLLMILFLFPLAQGLTLLPLLFETMARVVDWMPGLPICLLLALVECALVILVYALSLRGLGSLLQSREQRILEIVTSRAA
jgi:hypothetical protein